MALIRERSNVVYLRPKQEMSIGQPEHWSRRWRKRISPVRSIISHGLSFLCGGIATIYVITGDVPTLAIAGAGVLLILFMVTTYADRWM